MLQPIQRWLLAGAVSVVLLAAMTAGAAADPLADLLACRAIENSPARLACYDRATAALQIAAASPARASRAPLLDPRKTFGLPEGVVARKEVAAGMSARPITRLQTQIIGLTRTGDGRIVFRLSDGQVWRELLPDGDLLATVGSAVVIARGWLGSYWLKLPNGRDCKVDRLR